LGSEEVERRLIAILAADVAGYSRLVGADEEGTLTQWKAHWRELIDPKIKEHHGRIVRITGDGLLLEFESVLAAVRCAVDVQRAMVQRNADVPQEKRIEFRMGINVGDVIRDGNDVWGDGVNVAARLEALSEPGGICVSGRVEEDVHGRLDIVFEDTGERQLKNIARPVRVYRLRFEEGAKARRALSRPTKPSAAVSSFGLSEQIRFCTSKDGTRIAYATCGEGPPLLWIGHWIRHLEYDWDSPIWRPWLELLTRRHTLIRYDWRGSGLSDRSAVEFSMDKHIEDCEAVADAARLKSFILFGMAGGATMAMPYAVRHQERVSHLVLYGSQVRGRLARATTRSQFEEAEIRLKMIELGWPNETPVFGQFFTALHIPDATTEQLSAYNDLLRLTSSCGNAINFLRTLWQVDVRKIVSNVCCPTLVLHARGDVIIPFEEGRLVARLIPGARFVPLESRNHVLLGTEPAWQQMVAALEDFLPLLPVSETALSLDDLTPREREVLEIIAQGRDNNDIANRLKISEKTVRNHVSIIFDKLGVRTRAQAVARARDCGLGRRNFV
jgi:class 3 adenylate cyclase/pimeloyl-ACP methyl ester carboxylesterase/DNA-binding CsgD family transcriptional regulator